MKLRNPLRNERAAGAVEFALAAPVFLGMIIGISQLGVLYFANAGVKHAVDEGARRAAIYHPETETDAQIDAKIVAALRSADFGTKGVLTPSIVHGATSDGLEIIDVGVTYRVPLNFIFFETPPVTLSYTRRVYPQGDSAAAITPGGSAPSSSSSTTSSTGGTTTSTTSSTGGTTTSTTSSTGGTTTTSTGGTTTTSTTSSTGGTTTSSGNGNGNGNSSSGNGNGNNGNGACKRNCNR